MLVNNPGHMDLVGEVDLRTQHDGQGRSDWIDSALELASALQIAADLLVLSVSQAGCWLGDHWRSELEELFSRNQRHLQKAFTAWCSVSKPTLRLIVDVFTARGHHFEEVYRMIALESFSCLRKRCRPLLPHWKYTRTTDSFA